jgi:Anti-sigma-K factor rskA
VWHPDPDELALAALPAERRDAEVEAHLAMCLLCRGHVDSLRRTVDLALASGGESLDADPDAPPDRVWRAITQELAIVSDQPAPRARRTRSRWRRFALPVAAAVIGVAAGIAIGVTIATSTATSTGGGTTVAQLAPVTGLDPDGTGSVQMVTAGDGNRMDVRLDGITDLAGADFLEAWLMDPAGRKLLALGSLTRVGDTFHGTFTVPADLPVGEFDTVDISAEKWDGNPDHSRVSLLRGPLA